MQELFGKIMDRTLHLELERRSDSTTVINQLNPSLYGDMLNIFTAQDKVSGFLTKFPLYPHTVEAGDVCVWLELTILLEKTK
jgi:hypothetical protein